jgi:hypothetical protein
MEIGPLSFGKFGTVVSNCANTVEPRMKEPTKAINFFNITFMICSSITV